MVHVNLICRIYRLLNSYVLFHVNVQSLAVDHTGFSHEILYYFNIVPWSLRSVWTVTLNLARVFQHELSFVQLGLMLPRATRDYAYLLHVFVSRFGFNHLGPLGITLTANRALFPTHSSWIVFHDCMHMYHIVPSESCHRADREIQDSIGSFRFICRCRC